MSPQPTTTPAASAIPTGDNPMAERQIKRALALEFERGELLERINSNRTMLRLMADTEELSPEQEDWLETFYPSKEKGGAPRSEDEVEATRKAREAARKTKVA